MTPAAIAARLTPAQKRAPLVAGIDRGTGVSVAVLSQIMPDGTLHVLAVREVLEKEQSDAG